VQQDILDTFVDRGQLRHLREPTVLPNGKRIPGLKPDHPRQLALMQALVPFSHIAAASTCTTAQLHRDAAAALGLSSETYTLGSLRYDLSKLRARGSSRSCRIPGVILVPEGYKICVVCLKLFEKLYAPLTAGILAPLRATSVSQQNARRDSIASIALWSPHWDQRVDAVGLNAA
jgi:hypothetical protein